MEKNIPADPYRDNRSHLAATGQSLDRKRCTQLSRSLTGARPAAPCRARAPVADHRPINKFMECRVLPDPRKTRRDKWKSSWGPPAKGYGVTRLLIHWRAPPRKHPRRKASNRNHLEGIESTDPLFSIKLPANSFVDK